MDALDIGIVRHMGMDPFGREPKDPEVFRPAWLAKKLGVTPETIKDRLAKMEASGFMRGAQIVPNFRHFGLEASCYYYRFGDENRVASVAKELEAVDGVIGLYFFLNSQLCVNLAWRGPKELERRLRVLAALAGDGEFHKFNDLEMPPVSRPLSNLDWRILQALRGNALRGLNEVAEQIGVSAKTVKRRFDRMASEGSFFIVPKLRPDKAPGLLMASYLVFLDGEAEGAENGVRRAVDDRFVAWYCQAASPELGNVSTATFLFAVAEIDEYRDRIAKVPGVTRVDSLVFKGAMQNMAWIDDAIAAKIEATAAGSTEPVALRLALR